MTAALFNDWVEEGCIPEIKKYCSEKNIDFRGLVLVDNAPGHPMYVNEISEQVQFVFLPPKTTSLIQPMDQGVISIFKAYYLRRTIQQLISANDQDQLSMKTFWKNFTIADAIKNLS